MEDGLWERMLGNLTELDGRVVDGDIRPKEKLVVEGECSTGNMSYEDQLAVTAFGYAKLALHGMSLSMEVGDFMFDLYDRESVLIAISYLEAEVLNSRTRNEAHLPEIGLYAKIADAYRAAIGEERRVEIPEPEALNTSSSD